LLGSAPVLIAAGLLAGCGGSGRECLLDTDCDLGFRCEMEQCLPLGGVDSGMDGGRDGGSDGDVADTAPTDAGSDASRRLQRGFVTALSGAIVDVQTSSVSAFFEDLPAGDPCTRRAEGPCTVVTCPGAMPVDGGMADAGLPAVAPNAGRIGVQVDMGASVSIMPGADGRYMPLMMDSLLWTMGGQDVLFVAVGADVRTFAHTLDAPSSLTISAPTFPMTGPIMIDRGSDLALAWSGSSAGMLVATASQTAADGDTVTVRCEYAPTAGSGMIPAAALASLPVASDGSFALGVEASAIVVGTDPWVVNVTAATFALRPDGRPASGAARFE
jgi:hypothetical protein